MRAGRYAVVGGVTYQASFSASSPTVGLIVRGDRPSEDFAWDDRMGGRWYRSVRRDVCSRLFDVATSAYWRGQFPVSVERVDPENARAQINYFPGTVGPPVPRWHGLGHPASASVTTSSDRVTTSRVRRGAHREIALTGVPQQGRVACTDLPRTCRPPARGGDLGHRPAEDRLRSLAGMAGPEGASP